MRIKKVLRSLPLVLLIAMIFSGCKSYNSGREPVEPFEITGSFQEQTISPYSSHETCEELSRGQTLEYAFNSSRPVNFNIHYHGKDKIYYPVFKEHISALKGAFTTSQEMFDNKDQGYFCLMWENDHHRQVELIFTYEIRDN